MILLSMMSAGAAAQDLIARQAPVDRRMKDVNSVKINNTITATDLSNPAAHLYTNWVNANVRNATGYVSSNTRIDLRGFAMPTPSRKVTSPFGRRWGRQHEGLDIKVYVGDTISAAFDGKVRIVAYNARGYGYYVVIRHPNGLETLYGHLSKQLVAENQVVRAGQPIGLGGNTGRSYGSHLHFETRICGVPINPALMFDFAHQDVVSDFYTTTTSYGSDRHSAVAANTAHPANTEASHNEGLAANTAAAPAIESRAAEAEPAAQGGSQRANRRAAARQQPRANTHTVKAGDTLYAIARKHGVTLNQLCKANGLKPNSLIRAGQKLRF